MAPLEDFTELAPPGHGDTTVGTGGKRQDKMNRECSAITVTKRGGGGGYSPSFADASSGGGLLPTGSV